jgi:hypothetical protein
MLNSGRQRGKINRNPSAHGLRRMKGLVAPKSAAEAIAEPEKRRTVVDTRLKAQSPETF